MVTAAMGADTGKHFAGIAPPGGVPTAGQAMARAFACPFWVAAKAGHGAIVGVVGSPGKPRSIATNLINGKWQPAYIDYEHEEIGEVAGGFSAEEGAHVDRRTTDVRR